MFGLFLKPSLKEPVGFRVIGAVVAWLFGFNNEPLIHYTGHRASPGGGKSSKTSTATGVGIHSKGSLKTLLNATMTS